MEIIENALKDRRNILSEFESGKILEAYGIPSAKSILADSMALLLKAADSIGYPLVLKGCSPEIAHKTEKGLVRVDIRNEIEARVAFDEITACMDEKNKAVLVQEMISGQREFVSGLSRDPQFGPCVMFGLGGIFTEIIGDVNFRVAPLNKQDAVRQIYQLKSVKILEGFRGMQPVDIEAMADILIAVGKIGLDNKNIKEIDINPIKIKAGKPYAVDALIVLDSEVNANE